MSASTGVRLEAEDFPYPSRRMPVLARNGLVATSSPLAAQAGLRMLLQGGNAVDAAVATAAALTVLQPWNNGIGADAFALVWDGSRLHGLNGSGRAPAAHTPALFESLGLTEVPRHGWLSVTVPGAPAAWRDLHERFGQLPFEALFEPAIAYAKEGWPLEPETAAGWRRAQNNFSLTSPEFQGWYPTFAPPGREARAGDTWALPDHARTLRLIAETRAEAFYHGELAAKLAGFASATGGYVTKADLAAHTSTWVEPICASYRGYDVWEIPPNGQGIAALQALSILASFELGRLSRESVESYHLQIEAMKLAFADTRAYVADPDKVEVPVAGLLDHDYAKTRAALIGDMAVEAHPGAPPRGGTVYLCTADSNGMMVSFIQSNYLGFGSRVVVPGTGIALQNRGRGFMLEPGHPNQIDGGKRPYHTIIPAFLTRDGEAIGPFGVMGAAMQPQGHVQMIVNQIDYGMNPQTSLDAPRWRWDSGRQITLEASVPGHVANGLAARGHEVTVNGTLFDHGFGRGQIIRRLANGTYIAGSEPRADGCAVGF